MPKSLLEIVPLPLNGDFRILIVGSLASEKDPLSALEAFGRLTKTSKSRLRILGAGPLEKSLRARVKELELDDRVGLLGSVDDIEPHLAWADVLLLTSQTEGLPAVIIEAAAAAVPVVAYDVGGVGEAVTDGVTGRLVRAGGLESLAAALSYYASNPEESRRAGEAGKRLVAKSFTIEASARGFDEARSTLSPRQ
ncbi:MAG: glycosyltransferase [Actinobacteria bacterium]|nr:glycosyltransferase [Actinomycetota bacterium]